MPSPTAAKAIWRCGSGENEVREFSAFDFRPANENLFDYYLRNTLQYGNYNVFVWGGKNHDREEFRTDIEAPSAFFEKEIGLKRGDAYSVLLPTNAESTMLMFALNRIGVITNLVHPMTPP